MGIGFHGGHNKNGSDEAMALNQTPVVGLLGDFVSLAAARVAPDGRLLEANEAFLMLVGGHQVLGTGISELFRRPTFRQLESSVLSSESSYAGSLHLAVGGGERKAAAAAVLRDGDALLILVEVADWVELMEEVSGLRAALAGKENELARARQEAERQAGTIQSNLSIDALTGLANRRVLLERLDMEVARALRYRSPLSLAMAEVDGLGGSAQSQSQEAADAVLQTFARMLRVGCRLCDMPGRYGDNRFLVVLPHARLDGATVFARRVAARFAVQDISPGSSRFTASFGVAEYQEKDTPGDLIQRAESALRRSQEAGSPASPREE